MPKSKSPAKLSNAARKLDVVEPSSPRSSPRVSSPKKTPLKKAPSTPTRKPSFKSPIVTPTTPRYKRSSIIEVEEEDSSSSENEPPNKKAPKTPTKSSSTAVEDSIGNLKDTAVILPETKKAYSIVHKFTGSLGGNGAGGPIYGELTIKSMQKVVQIMKEYMEFDSNSRFIDVGAGLGKPNIHVAMDPKVEFSYGIEVNPERWHLSLSNLKPLLKEAIKDSSMGHNIILDKGDIIEAKSFDPFTHVYMFDIGFPGFLFAHLSEMFNNSTVSNYLISYYGPKKIIEQYGFEVELMFKVSVSMHGSGEYHSGYYYKRVKTKKKTAKKSSKAKKALNLDDSSSALPNDVPCDPVFEDAWRTVRSGPEKTLEWTVEKLEKFENSGRPRRERKERIPHNV